MIDIVLVNYRSADDTLAALHLLAPWRHGVVWLVDNSAHEPDWADDSARLRQTSAALPWVRQLDSGGNVGFAAACNLAFAQSRSKFFMLLNPDARITEADLLRLAQTLEENPGWGAVSPQIFWNDARSFVLPPAYPQTPWHSMALALSTRWATLARWRARRDWQQATRKLGAGSAFAVDFLAGAALLVRRSAVLDSGGLFDPRYFMFFEDADLSLRLRRHGYGLAMASQASAVHEYRHKAFKGALMAQSQRLYFEKNFPRFYRCSRQLHALARLTRPVPTQRWFRVLPKPVSEHAEFIRLTEGAAVLAFSPSTLMLPAIFRPFGALPTPFDFAEWALLEPGAYTALLQHPHSTQPPFWLYFERCA